MPFFDELGKKISKTGQDVLQKNKLSGFIYDEEKAIKEAYLAIGEKYFELHSENFEPEFEELVNSVKQSKIKLAEYEEEVKKLKGIVKCPHCNQDIPYGTPFCSFCGLPTNEQPANEPVNEPKPVKYCTNCGNPLSADAQFCTACGNKAQ